MNTTDTELRQTWVAVEGPDGRTRMEACWVLMPVTAAVTVATVAHAA